MRRWFAFVIALTLCTISLVRAQSDAPAVFRSGVNVVAVNVYVTDSGGNPVTDLTAADFEVREDGKRQTVSSVSVVNVAAPSTATTTALATAVEPDVQTNTGDEGRLFVIAIDDLQPAAGIRARRILRQFIERHFGQNDRAAVVYIGHGRAHDTQPFTNNRTLLLRSLDRISGWPEDVPKEGGVADLGSANSPLFLWPAIKDLMDSLAKIPMRRKSVLMITSDVFNGVFNAVETPLSATASGVGLTGDIAREAMRSALRGGVTIYPIDPIGASMLDAVSGAAEAPNSIQGERERRERQMTRRANLHDLGTLTGGFALVGSNNYDGAFERIDRETRSYYLLGFESDRKPDGKWRKLQVRARRPGVEVHTISGYLSATADGAANEAKKTPSPLVSALSSPVSVGGLPMQVFAVPYRLEGPEAAVTVVARLDGRTIELAKQGDAYNGVLEVAFVVTGLKGPMADVKYTATLALQPETFERMRAEGVQVSRELRLKPGSYQVRVGVTQPGGKAGSVLYDLDVPDFAAAPLAMTGLLLTSAATPLELGATSLTQALPQALALRRHFTANGRLTVIGEVYDNARGAGTRATTVRAELRGADGQTVRTLPSTRQETERGDVVRLDADLPLSGLAAGAYVIHAEATSEGVATSMARDIPIWID